MNCRVDSVQLAARAILFRAFFAEEFAFVANPLQSGSNKLREAV